VHLLRDCRGLPANTLAQRADLVKARAFEVAYASEWPLKPGLVTTTAQKWSAALVNLGGAVAPDDRSLTLASRQGRLL
jgi:hypothetical protein